MIFLFRDHFFPEKWFLKIQLEEVRVTFNKASVRTEMGGLVKWASAL